MRISGLKTLSKRVTLAASALTLLAVSPAFAKDAAQASEDRVQKAVATVEALAQKGIDEKTIVGLAIGVVQKDKLIYAKGFGLRKVGAAEKVDADTVFQLASVSKPISSTVVAALVGEGKINWDSKISDLDSSFQMSEPWVSREITIRDLYCHRSGWPEHAGDLLEDYGYDRDDVLHRMRYQKPEASFRSHYAYTNFGITEAAVAAAKSYDLTWETAAEEKLFKPLGMKSTSGRFSDFVSRPNRALGHVMVDGKWVQKCQRQPDSQSPAGGVSSSVNDLARWMRLQLGGGKIDGRQFVSENALTETHKPHMLTSFNPFNELPGFYGLGMNVNYDEQGRLRLSHSGAFAMGAATNVTMMPGEKIGIVVLTNSYPIGFAEALTATFMDIALDGKTSQDWIPLYKKVFSNPATLGLDNLTDYTKPPANKVAALPSDAYVGAFFNDFYGDVIIAAQGDKLSIEFGPKKITLDLNHYDRDTFTFETIGENASGLSGVTFLVDYNRKASALRIEAFDKNGQGTFVRKN